MEKRTSKKGLIIALVIAILVILGMGGYIVYDKIVVSNKNISKNEKVEEKQSKSDTSEELNTQDSNVTKLMSNFNVLTGDALFIGDDLFGYLYKQNLYTKDTISNDTKITLAWSLLDTNKDQLEVTHTKEEMSQAMKSIFGKDITYIDKGVTAKGGCRVPRKYDSEKSLYTLSSKGCGGTLQPRYQTKINKAYRYKDKMEITEYAIYIKYEVHDDRNRVANLYTADQKTVIDTISAEGIDSRDLIEEYKDKLDTYKYTFNLEDGNYYFHSVEKIAK